MVAVPFDTFASACRNADERAFTAFVAGLYEARGWRVERLDAQRLVLAGEDGTRTLGFDGVDLTSGTVDAVVTRSTDPPEAPEGVETLALPDIHEQLRYAVDAETTRRLLGEHLDIAPEASETSGEPPESETTESTTGGVAALASGWGLAATSTLPDVLDLSLGETETALRTVAVVAVAAIAAVGLIGGAALLYAGGTDTTGGAGSSTGVFTPTGASAAGDAAGTGPDIDEGEIARFVPRPQNCRQSETDDSGGTESGPTPIDLEDPGRLSWISESGAVDQEALAASSRSALADGPVTLTLRYVELENGRIRGQYREAIRIEDGRYTATVRTLGTFDVSGPRIVGRVSDYREPGIVRRSGSLRAGVTSANETIPTRVQEVVFRYASSGNGRVVGRQQDGNGTTYRLAFEGQSALGMCNPTGIAYVTERGVIRYGRWSYRLPREKSATGVVTVELVPAAEAS